MRDEWEKVTLGEVATISSGSTPSRSNSSFWNGNIPWVTTTQIQNNVINSNDVKEFITDEGQRKSSLKIIPKGTLLMAMYGQGKTRGQVGILNFDSTINQACAAIKVTQKVSSLYLYQYFQFKYEDIRALSNSGGQKNLSAEIIKSIEFNLPPLSEQKKIAETLSIWDSAIEKTEKLIFEKEKMFDGISQKLFRKAKTKHKICEYLSSRNEKCVPNESIPLYSLTIEDGVTPKSDRYDREALVKDLSEKEYKVVYPGDIVFNPANLRWGAIARSDETRKVAVSPIYEVLKLDSSKINSDYLTFLLTSKDKIGYYATKTEGTLVERMAVKVDVFLNFEIEIEEDREKQKSSAEALATLKKEISLLKKQLEQYKLQKQGLMQKLLTGEWRVK